MPNQSKKNLIVVKVGSGLLTDKQGGIDSRLIASLARQIATLRKNGKQVVLVSSGAISAGMSMLGLEKRPRDLASLQACATIGQPRLMGAYEAAFSKHKFHAAQILITYWDLDSRKLFHNTRTTTNHLLSLGNCVPIFNENDALSFEEIEMLNTFGDNDRLSAEVALLLEASQLIILSGIEGLMTSPDGNGQLIRKVSVIDEKIESYAGHSNSERSVGGMISKLRTARIMLERRIPMVIANGRKRDVLLRIDKGEPVGTTFCS